MGDPVGQVVSWVTPNILWIGVVIYLITHPEVAEKWGAMLSRLLSGIAAGAERASVSLDIQGKIDSFSNAMNKEVTGVLPHGVKIDWVVGEITRESFIKDGRVIIRMNHHKNQDENIANAAVEYVSRGFLPESRPHVDDRVMKSADLICTKKLLEREQKSALSLYYTEILGPARRTDSELDKYVVAMQSLDELGYFTQIFLPELQELGVRMEFSLPSEAIKGETRRFVDFLDQKITKKKTGVDVDPTFEGDGINTSIVYVSRHENVGPHLGWIKKCINRDIRTIYICAFGERNISLVKKLEGRLESNKRLTKGFSREFRLPWRKGRKKDNICVRYEVCDVGADTA